MDSLRRSAQQSLPVIRIGMQRILITVLWAAGALLLDAPLAISQNRTVDVHITAHLAPSHAVGLVVTESDTLQYPISQWEQITEDTLLVSFTYDASQVKDPSYATAMVVSNEGEVRYGDVKMLAGSVANKSFLSMPACTTKELPDNGSQSQIGAFESLLEIRSARREANQLRIQSLLQGEFLEKLQRLERGFGLIYPRPLSAELPPFELLDRLHRLVNAIQNYQNTPKEQGR